MSLACLQADSSSKKGLNRPRQTEQDAPRTGLGRYSRLHAQLDCLLVAALLNAPPHSC